MKKNKIEITIGNEMLLTVDSETKITEVLSALNDIYDMMKKMTSHYFKVNNIPDEEYEEIIDNLTIGDCEEAKKQALKQ